MRWKREKGNSVNSYYERLFGRRDEWDRPRCVHCQRSMIEVVGYSAERDRSTELPAIFASRLRVVLVVPQVVPPCKNSVPSVLQRLPERERIGLTKRNNQSRAAYFPKRVPSTSFPNDSAPLHPSPDPPSFSC